MSNALSTLLISKVLLFCLALFRVTAILMVTPIFGDKTIPPQVKAACAFLISLVLFPIIGHGVVIPTSSSLIFMLLAGREILAGLIIGYASTLIFCTVRLSGEYVNRNMGLGMARIIDPTTNQRVAAISNFQYTLAILMFLAIDGHHWLLVAVSKSFEIIPVGGACFDNAVGEKLIGMVGQVFPVAVKIIAPAFVVLILMQISIALISRAVPGMNVLIVGMPLRIGLGLIGVALSIPMFYYVFTKMFRMMRLDMMFLIRSMQ